MKALCQLIAGIALLNPPAVRAIGGRDTPPLPSAPHQTHFARAQEAKLENGMDVIVVERRELPLLAVQMLLRSGAEVDPPERGGAADMTASLLTKGTESMSAPQIANAIESLGGTIFAGGGWNSSFAGVVVMSDKKEPAMAVLADVLLHPVFKKEELERLRKQATDSLRVDLREPGSLADYARVRVVFPEGEYAHPRTGTLETLQAIGREDVVNLYRTWYRPDNAVLLLVGDISFEGGKRTAQEYFGDWRANDGLAKPKATPLAKEWKPRHIVIDMKQAGQAAVLLAAPSLKRASPDYYSGLVANAVLGNGFGSWLNREIRIKRGLSYGAGSNLDARRDAGQFIVSAQTKNESAAEVAKLMQVELRRLGREPAKGEELRSRKAMLTGRYARSMETNFGVAGQISSIITCDLPLNSLDKYIPSINQVTSTDIASFAREYLSKPPGLVVVGQAPAFAESLKKDWNEVEVIPESNLDLNRTELVKQKIVP